MTNTICTWSQLPTNQCAHCRNNNTIDTTHRPPATSRRPPMRVVYPVAHQQPTTKILGARTLPDDTKHWDTNDYITALCDPTTAAEPYRHLHHNDDQTFTIITERHRTTNPPLLQQLWSAAETSRGMDSGNTRKFASRPAASLEALDIALDIEREVHQLLHRLGETDTHDHWPDTTAAVRHLGSLVTAGQYTTSRNEARTIRHWWAAARVITGWDLPAFRPNNTCPMCAMRGSLRIKWPTGLCVDCKTIWDEDNVGLLVEHIRNENGENEQAVQA